MLRKWIEEIRNKTDLYKIESWKYQISGNVIEISILPAYLKDKKKYRCAVISVGRVLKALTCKLEQRDSNFHVQSFPTLENPGVVASIRIDESRELVQKPASFMSKSFEEKDPEILLHELAREYQLEIVKIQGSDILERTGLNQEDFNSWFGLFSAHNNPFTWLNIGYWKESFQDDCHNQFPSREYKVIDFCDAGYEDQSLFKQNNRFLHSIIGLNTSVPAG